MFRVFKLLLAVAGMATMASLAYITLGANYRQPNDHLGQSYPSTTPSIRELPRMVIVPGKKKIAGDLKDGLIGQTTKSHMEGGQDLITELVTRPETDITESIFDYFDFNMTMGELNETLPFCQEKPATLVGKLKVLKEPLPWETIQMYNQDVATGGVYTPPDCVPRYRVALIVPFRDREQHLRIFLRHMHPILQRQQLHYRIFVINQSDSRPFNRASLFNVGYLESLALGDFDCFIFHDVDLLAENDMISYGCKDSPMHLTSAYDTQNYRLPYKALFGGGVAISARHFKLLNGFSNQFWGWGGEDDDMSNRVRYRKLRIHRQSKQIVRYTMLKHSAEKKNPMRFRRLKQGMHSFDTDGLNNVKYQIVDLVQEPLFTNITVKLFKTRPVRKKSNTIPKPKPA